MKLNKHTTASFDVDAQKGFTPLRPAELPVPGGDEIVGALNAQAELARLRLGSKDAHCRQARWIADDEHPQLSPVAGDNVDLRWNAHCIMGTPGAELLDGLPAPIEYDFFVWKGVEPDLHPYGACYHDLAGTRSTGAIEFLKAAGIERVIVGGLALDYCVKNTALQLRRAGFDVILNLAASRGIATETVETALAEMKAAGVEVVEDARSLAPAAV